MKMSSLHALLDATEAVILENFQDPKNPTKAQQDRERFLDSLYKPTPEAVKINGDGYKPIPAGFENGGEDDFDWGVSCAGAE